MTYRRLGDSGLVVSVVGIGCNNFGRKLDADGTRAVVDAALDAGITLFDTADIYGEPQGSSEELLGAALKGRRDDVVVATKFGMDMAASTGRTSAPAGARRYIARAVEASLRRLGTDYIDLYQMHEPDPATPIDETLAALDDLVRAGKVRYLGNSNFAGWQIADADWTARTDGRTPFISAQNQYSLLRPRGRGRGRAGLRAVRARHAAVLPARQRAAHRQVPARRGRRRPARRLSGGAGTRSGSPPPTGTPSRRSRRTRPSGADSLLEVAIGGLAARPAVTSVIAGATTPEQVRANAAAGTWEPERRGPGGTARHPLSRL